MNHAATHRPKPNPARPGPSMPTRAAPRCIPPYRSTPNNCTPGHCPLPRPVALHTEPHHLAPSLFLPVHPNPHRSTLPPTRASRTVAIPRTPLHTQQLPCFPGPPVSTRRRPRSCPPTHRTPLHRLAYQSSPVLRSPCRTPPSRPNPHRHIAQPGRPSRHLPSPTSPPRSTVASAPANQPDPLQPTPLKEELPC